MVYHGPGPTGLGSAAIRIRLTPAGTKANVFLTNIHSALRPKREKGEGLASSPAGIKTNTPVVGEYVMISGAAGGSPG